MPDFMKLLETVEASIYVRVNELKKQNITINGKRTSVTLEPQIWDILKEIAEDQNTTIHDLCSYIYDRKSDDSSLSSAIRVFLISYLYVVNKRMKAK